MKPPLIVDGKTAIASTFPITPDGIDWSAALMISSGTVVACAQALSLFGLGAKRSRHIATKETSCQQECHTSHGDPVNLPAKGLSPS